jgi:hypothetical protein
MILNMNSIGYRDFVKIHSDNVKDEIQHWQHGTNQIHYLETIIINWIVSAHRKTFMISNYTYLFLTKHKSNKISLHALAPFYI